ncbi:MAG: hypothetical protein ACD_65C00004G0004 [uncultured bacterium]|nr:MAG: hypothetical protein ACD_65C00004G0004 [uncultured bacterium]
MIKFILNLISPYVHPFEKKADKFFQSIKSTSNPEKVRSELQILMSRNLVVLDLWMEKKYKGYKYLKKGVRRRMYENVEMLNKEFDQYVVRRTVKLAQIRGQIESHGLKFPEQFSQKIEYLSLIMSYLRPGKRYEYLVSANFGKLLKDPTKEKLIGDCNQIVTLYTYLYSRKFPVSDLKIKILPKHVCLHFEGIDIEATNATFHHYKDFEYILPITELISTNLLDVTDDTEQTGEIDPRTVVKRAQLAFAISSMRELVERNLKAAYQNLGITMMNKKNFDSAIFFFEKLGDQEMIRKACHNAAIHYLNSGKLKKAEFYAGRAGSEDLKKSVTRNQGVKLYKQGSYNKALEYFKRIGDDGMVKACYQAQYNKVVRKVKGVKTIADARKHRADYQKMLDLAHKMGNEEAAGFARDMLGKI